jgi:hypothetical protein
MASEHMVAKSVDGMTDVRGCLSGALDSSGPGISVRFCKKWIVWGD